VRKEVRDWWLQAQKDLESARKNLGIEEYHLTAFLCQQSVEKALRGVHIRKLKRSPGATHSLVFLGQETGIPKEYHNGLRRLSPDFVITRYPDAAQALPHELYDESIATERIDITGKVVEWASRELQE